MGSRLTTEDLSIRAEDVRYFINDKDYDFWVYKPTWTREGYKVAVRFGKKVKTEKYFMNYRECLNWIEGFQTCLSDKEIWECCRVQGE